MKVQVQSVPTMIVEFDPVRLIVVSVRVVVSARIAGTMRMKMHSPSKVFGFIVYVQLKTPTLFTPQV